MDYAAEYDEGHGGPQGSFFRWLIPALVVSILLHILFWYWAGNYRVDEANRQAYERIIPRTFHIERVDIDPKLLEPEPSDVAQQAAAPQATKLPDDKPAFEQLMADNPGPAQAPKFDTPVLDETPALTSTTLEQTIQSAQKSGAESVLQDPQSAANAILDPNTEQGNQTAAKLLAETNQTGHALANAGPLRGGKTPGFSNLDDLLAQTGPLTAETAPILMPTDLLFDYDQAQLKPEALASLEKLGTLIQRNPQATFLIEGHTDSFGSDEYNMALSQRRADSVKSWLVTSLNIPDPRVDARGFGETRLIAPSTGSIDEQKINRRVEIVIRVPKAASPAPQPNP